MPAATTSSRRRRSGTALALAEVADDLGLTVALLGTPAEEAGGGKALLLQAGTFDDVAAAVMVHPGPTDIAAARSLALSEAIVHYRGKESHAAVAPYLGVNAADAVTVAQVAIGLLRQQLAPGQLVHGIVTDGGQAVNVIPGHATLQYAMRAIESDSLRELEGRMFACFAAGALATGCEYEIDNAGTAHTRNSSPTNGWPKCAARRCADSGASRWRPSSRRRCRWAAPIWAT